jgi:hypothetical protein
MKKVYAMAWRYMNYDADDFSSVWTKCWKKWHERRTDAQRISHVRETSHQNATSKSQASNKQDPFSLLSTNLVRQQ